MSRILQYPLNFILTCLDHSLKAVWHVSLLLMNCPGYRGHRRPCLWSVSLFGIHRGIASTHHVHGTKEEKKKNIKSEV